MSTVRINVSFPEDLAQRIDAFTFVNGMSRSGFLALCVRKYLDEAKSTPDMKKILALLRLMSFDDNV